jgi:hypothetical protein
VIRIKHLFLLVLEFGRYAMTNRRAWPLMLVLFLLMLSAFAVATQVATPFIYTLF